MELPGLTGPGIEFSPVNTSTPTPIHDYMQKNDLQSASYAMTSAMGRLLSLLFLFPIRIKPTSYHGTSISLRAFLPNPPIKQFDPIPTFEQTHHTTLISSLRSLLMANKVCLAAPIPPPPSLVKRPAPRFSTDASVNPRLNTMQILCERARGNMLASQALLSFYMPNSILGARQGHPDHHPPQVVYKPFSCIGTPHL